MKSWHMFPLPAMNNVGDSRRRHAIDSGKFVNGCVALCVALTHFRYLVRCQFCTWSTLALCLSAFGHFVDHIVGWSANKQMIRIAARRIVALVAYMHTFWDGTMSRFVSCTMTSEAWTMLGSNLDSTVTFGRFAALPLPTIIGSKNTDLRPKSFGKRLCRLMLKLMTWEKTDRLTFDMPKLRNVLGGDSSLLPATAMAVTVGNIVRGIIGVHENLHSLAKPPNDSTRCGGNFIGFSSFDYTTGGAA